MPLTAAIPAGTQAKSCRIVLVDSVEEHFPGSVEVAEPVCSAVKHPTPPKLAWLHESRIVKAINQFKPNKAQGPMV